MGNGPGRIGAQAPHHPLATPGKVAAALQRASSLGYTCAVTGDGADELLGGYNFTHGLEERAWVANRDYMACTMEFGSGPLGEHFGVWVASPFTTKHVVRAALRFSKDECVASVPPAPPPPPLLPAQAAPLPARVGIGLGNGSSASDGGDGDGGGLQAHAGEKEGKEGSKAAPTGPPQQQRQQQQQQRRMLGKLPLRWAFPNVTSCWRGKDPIEVGCGTTELGNRPWMGDAAGPGYFEGRMTDQEFEHEQAWVARQHGVQLRDKEQLQYYRIFRQVFPNGVLPGRPRYGSDPCPMCGYQLSRRDQPFCVTCGHYDAALRDRHSRSGKQRRRREEQERGEDKEDGHGDQEQQQDEGEEQQQQGKGEEEEGGRGKEEEHQKEKQWGSSSSSGSRTTNQEG